MKLYLDTETYSETPIGYGTYRYAADAEVMIVTYAIDDGPVGCWDRTAGGPMPVDLAVALDDPHLEVLAWNAMFDRNVLRLGDMKLEIPIERWRCMMVRALSHALPGGLGPVGEIMGLPADKMKDKEGRALIHLFCKPRPKRSKLRRATRDTHPQEWEQFLEYATQDIVAMRELDAKLPRWNSEGDELALWHLDQRINDRGFALDFDLIDAALEAVDIAKDKLGARTQDLTGGNVGAPTQRDVLLRHILAEYGVDLPDMQKSTLERRIDDPGLPDGLRELLAVRLEASTTSTSKYKAMTQAANDDGRARGTIQHNGAGRTARAAGRKIQPQNFPRPTMKQPDIELGIEALKARCAEMIFDDIMSLTSNTLRGAIIAPPGKKLVVADYSNIEGRGLAWLAGEEWKLRAFRDFDAGLGHDLYTLAYAKAFGVRPEDVDKEQRQLGKVMELALGYEGGVGAFVTFAAGYNVDLEAMAEAAYDTLPDDLRAEAESFYEWTVEQHRPTFGLSRRAFVTCDTFKRGWREAHPAVVRLWRKLEGLAVRAVQEPGRTFSYRTFRFRRDGAWLRISMPKGTVLCYPHPKVDDDGKLSYMGLNQYTRKWQRIGTYGGKIAENATQKFARDVLYQGMQRLDQAAYDIVLHVHDEPVTEVPDGPKFNVEWMCEALTAPIDWAPDLPLAAAGYEAYRYRKD